MPRAILEFQLPEEREEHREALEAGTVRSILWNFQQDFLRRNIKYGPTEELHREVREDLKGQLVPISKEHLDAVIVSVLEHTRNALNEEILRKGIQDV